MGMLLTYITEEDSVLVQDELAQKRLEWELNALFKKYKIVALQGGVSIEAVEVLLENIASVLSEEEE